MQTNEPRSPSIRRVCESEENIRTNSAQGYHEALALVNHQGADAKPKGAGNDGSKDGSAPEQGDGQLATKSEDLRQAKELVALHYEMKSKHANGEVDAELRNARDQVEQVLDQLA